MGYTASHSHQDSNHSEVKSTSALQPHHCPSIRYEDERVWYDNPDSLLGRGLF